METINAIVTSPVGLYAASASKLVEAVKIYESHIAITYEGKTLNMKSIMGVLSLGIPEKAKVQITIEGQDEKAARDDILGLIEQLEIGHETR